MSDATTVMDSAPDTQQASGLVVAVSLLGTFLAGAVVPAGGLIAAGVLWFTILKNNRVARIAALVIGVVMTAWLIFLFGPTEHSFHVGTPVQVG